MKCINLFFFQVIPDEICQRAGLSAVWFPSNKLGAHAYRHVTAHSQGN
jgi:hypothetical protein